LRHRQDACRAAGRRAQRRAKHSRVSAIACSAPPDLARMGARNVLARIRTSVRLLRSNREAGQ
jgi:hypothetical protein